jgi:hypothetical protein
VDTSTLKDRRNEYEYQVLVPAAYFGVPPSRVVEVGLEVEI